MINKLIELSLKNRFIIIVLTVLVVAWGGYTLKNMPIDAFPDLSENQVLVYADWMGLLVREAKDHGIPLEFNFLGYREGRNYPDRRFLELVAKENLPMVLGCDAHRPEDLTVDKTEAKVRRLLTSLGIPVLETVELRRIEP